MSSPLFVVAGTSSPYLSLLEAAGFSRCLDSGGLESWSTTGNCNKVVFSPDSAMLVIAHAASPYLSVLETTNWTPVNVGSTAFMGAALCCKFSPDGSLLAIGHTNSPRFTVYETATWTNLTINGAMPGSAVQSVAFSPDGTKLAISFLTAPFFQVYDVTSGFSSITTPTTDVLSASRACTFSPDGALLALGSSTAPFLVVYNTVDWSKVTIPVPPTSTTYALSFSPNGALLAVGSTSSPRLSVYETSAWAKLTIAGTQPIGQVNDLVFYDGGAYLAAAFNGSSDSIARYNTTTWARLTSISPSFGNSANGCAFSPNAITKEVQGVIRDDTHTPVQRTVRLYRRSTGALLASVTSGADGSFGPFSFASQVEVQRVALDDAAGALYNDLIDRVIPA